MTGRCVKTDIRLSRLSGGAHLSWMIDELDLPWLLHVIRELDVEEDATVSLADPDGDGRLIVRVDESGFAVERSAAGTRTWLARLPAAGGVPMATGTVPVAAESVAADPAATDGGDGAGSVDAAIDFDAVREAVSAFFQDRPPSGDLCWVGRGQG